MFKAGVTSVPRERPVSIPIPNPVLFLYVTNPESLPLPVGPPEALQMFAECQLADIKRTCGKHPEIIPLTLADIWLTFCGNLAYISQISGGRCSRHLADIQQTSGKHPVDNPAVIPRILADIWLIFCRDICRISQISAGHPANIRRTIWKTSNRHPVDIWQIQLEGRYLGF